MDTDEFEKVIHDLKTHWNPGCDCAFCFTTMRAIHLLEETMDHLKRCKCGEPDEEYLYGHFSHDGDTLIQDRKKV